MHKSMHAASLDLRCHQPPDERLHLQRREELGRADCVGHQHRRACAGRAHPHPPVLPHRHLVLQAPTQRLRGGGRVVWGQGLVGKGGLEGDSRRWDDVHTFLTAGSRSSGSPRACAATPLHTHTSTLLARAGGRGTAAAGVLCRRSAHLKDGRGRAGQQRARVRGGHRHQHALLQRPHARGLPQRVHARQLGLQVARRAHHARVHHVARPGARMRVFVCECE